MLAVTDQLSGLLYRWIPQWHSVEDGHYGLH